MKVMLMLILISYYFIKLQKHLSIFKFTGRSRCFTFWLCNTVIIFSSSVKSCVFSSFVDPHTVFADQEPDPAFFAMRIQKDADPDPALQNCDVTFKLRMNYEEFVVT